MFKTNDSFNFRNIDDIIPEMIYLYLFEGQSLREIENQLFMTYEGWLSKSFLNYYGIDTSQENDNKGIYKNRPIPEVVDELKKSSNITHVRVAKLLKDKYL